MADQTPPAVKELSGVYLWRWQNLQKLISMVGNSEQFTHRVKGIPSGDLSRARRKVRNVPVRWARNIEVAFNLPAGCMDLPDFGRSTQNKPQRQRVIKVLYEFDGKVVMPCESTLRVAFQSEDPGAYAILVKGPWCEPRAFHGELLVVSPNTPPSAGDMVAAQLMDGLKIFPLQTMKPDHIVAMPFGGNRRQTITADQVNFIFPIIAILLKHEAAPE